MTKGDKILIVFIFLLAMSSMIFIKKQGFSNDNKYVSVQINGEEKQRIIFDKKIEGKKIPIKTKYGYNLIEIGNNSVRVLEADCPDKLDVQQGWISNVGEVIVCIPNKFILEIKGEKADKDIDIMNY